MQPILHVVLIRFADGAGEDDRALVRRRFLALAEAERDGRRYLRSVRGGPNTSPEGLGHGYDDGFVVEFADAADRAYYLGLPEADGADPDHAAFVALLTPLAADVLVFDVG